MDRKSRNALESFIRVQEFLTQHPLPDAAAVLGAQATELAEVVAELTSETVDQETGIRFVQVHVESQRTLRSQLYFDHMRPISRVAREVFGATGMERAFALPKDTSVNRTLLSAARAMAEAAEKQKDVFVRHALADDFIEKLRAGADALEDASTKKTVSARIRTMATAAVKDQVRRGRKAVRLLDAILLPKLAKDPKLLAAWEGARRVHLSSTPEIVIPAPQIAPVKVA
jgi:hypothetical protein